VAGGEFDEADQLFMTAVKSSSVLP